MVGRGAILNFFLKSVVIPLYAHSADFSRIKNQVSHKQTAEIWWKLVQNEFTEAIVVEQTRSLYCLVLEK